MVQIDAHAFRHALHLIFNLILHISTTEEALELCPPEEKVRGEEHESENDMRSSVPHPFRPRQICILNQCPTRPAASDLDAVDRTAEELIVALHNSQISSDEDELFGPFLLVAEYLSNALAHLFLHLKCTLLLVFSLQPLPNMRRGAAIASRVRPHQRGRSEEVRTVDAPTLYDRGNSRIVEGQKSLPELAVFVSEFGRHMNIKAVVDQNQLCGTVWPPANKHVAWMRVAVYPSPTVISSQLSCTDISSLIACLQEHLCAE